MKLRSIALASLAALAGQAFAAPDLTPVTVADVQAAITAGNVLYISGSSAAKGIIKGLVNQNCGGPLATWTGPTLTSGSISGGAGNIYACKVLATNDWALPENTVVAVNKRDFLGSGYGVFPVAQQIAIDFTDISSCVDNTATTCTGTTLVVPNAGISDLEPTIFNGTFNKPADFSSAPAVATADFGTPKAIFSQVFGVAVTAKLAAEMIAAGNFVTINGVQTPNLATAQVANLLSTGVKTQAWKGIATAANATTGVNICTRDLGSGTRAAFNTLFVQNGLNGLTPISALQTTAGVTAVTDTTGQVYVNEAGSGGGVQGCLANANGLTKGFGIGLLTLGTGTTANYVFAAIDGVAPTRDNAKVGKYNVWAETFMQLNKQFTVANGANANAVAFLGKFQTQAALVDNLGNVGSPAVSGVFALPGASAVTAALKCSTYPTAASAGALNASATAAAIAAGTYPAIGDTTSAWATGNANNFTVADAFCSRFTRGGVTTKTASFFK
jgi:hypothetical protein